MHTHHALLHPQPIYTKMLPGARLKRYIDSYHIFRANIRHDAPLLARNFPNGNVQFWLNFGDTILVPNRQHTLPLSGVLGVQTSADLFVFAGRIDLINIQFRPAGAHAFLGIPLHELTSQVVSFDALWDSGLAQQFLTMQDDPFPQRITRIEAVLLQQLNKHQGIANRVEHAIAMIQRTDGQVAVRTLLHDLHISKSQLERDFNTYLGVTPKQYARIERFRHMLIKMRHQPDLAALALEGGYADQAHFTREFKAFSGLTPTEFVRTQPNASFVQDKADEAG